MIDEPHPPRLIAVVDTEEEFDWSAPFDRRSVGVSHMRRIGELQQAFEDHGIRPVYAVDFAVADQAEAFDSLGPIVRDGRALIGAHLHPWITPPFTERVCDRNSFPGNLSAVVERDKLAALSERIAESFGTVPTMYKAGRHGIGPNTFAILEELGFTIDLSPMPSFDYQPGGGPDFSRAGSEPAWVGPTRSVLSIPNTGGYVGRLPASVRAWLHALVQRRSVRWLRLPGVLSRLRLTERIALSPEGYTLAEMRRLTRQLYAAGQRLFVLKLHSPSIAPGHTPYVRDEAEKRALLVRLGRYLDFFRRELGGGATDPLSEWRIEAARKTAAVHGCTCGALRTDPPPRPAALRSGAKPVIAVEPIDDDMLEELAVFWHDRLNRQIPCHAWVAAFSHPWHPAKPNNGFALRADGRLIGALGAIYSRQAIGAGEVDCCNLTSLVIEETHRSRSMDLLSACLAQKGYVFTNFTPSPSVARMLHLLRFTELDGAEYVVPHTPLMPRLDGARLLESTEDIAAHCTGVAARQWRDHAGLLRAFAIGRDQEWCTVFWHPAPIKRLAGARILGMSDASLYLRWQRTIGAHLLRQHGAIASRVPAHLLPRPPAPGFRRPGNTPRLYRGSGIEASQVSFLYSELVALPI